MEIFEFLYFSFDQIFALLVVYHIWNYFYCDSVVKRVFLSLKNTPGFYAEHTNVVFWFYDGCKVGSAIARYRNHSTIIKLIFSKNDIFVPTTLI